MPLLDKGTTSSDGGREKWGDRNWGRGIFERDRQGCFLFPAMLRFVWLLCRGISISICVFMNQASGVYNICCHVAFIDHLLKTYKVRILCLRIDYLFFCLLL